MRFTQLELTGAWLVDVERAADERGSFARTFCADEFAAHGLPTWFPQCNLSYNELAGTLRGMHYNRPPFEESKLVRCVRGGIHDVIVDMRTGSPTYRRWLGVDLTADNARSLFVPEGFAHGFVTLADQTDVHYHMGQTYVPDAGIGFRWDDPAIGIGWPIRPSVISDRDATYPNLEESVAPTPGV